MVGAGNTPRRVLLLAAHPNDEFGLAATLRGHVRRGDEVWVSWFARDDREQVQQRRHAEALEAMAMIGVPEEHLVVADLPPIVLPAQLPDVVDALRDVAARIEPVLVYVPAYEGGHPDHDALNFAAWEVLALEGVEVREYPLYRRAQGRRFLRRIPRFARMIPGIGEPDLHWLEPDDVRFKHDLWRIYKTQHPMFDVLLRFSGDEHRFFTTEQTRTLPLRDYTKPPHDLPLLYEHLASSEMPYTFEEFATAVRRYYWSGGIGDDDAL